MSEADDATILAAPRVTRTPAGDVAASDASGSHLRHRGLRRGVPFETLPRYAPIDEDHYPFPTTA
jgi:hypothetical protein